MKLCETSSPSRLNFYSKTDFSRSFFHALQRKSTWFWLLVKTLWKKCFLSSLANITLNKALLVKSRATFSTSSFSNWSETENREWEQEPCMKRCFEDALHLLVVMLIATGLKLDRGHVTHQVRACVLTSGAWWTRLCWWGCSTPPCWRSWVRPSLQPRTACCLWPPRRTAAAVRSSPPPGPRCWSAGRTSPRWWSLW